MNAKEELTKLLMESYDRGVEDAKQAAIESLAQVVAIERESCAKLMDDMAAQDNLTNYYKVAARAIRERKS
ncbi:MAG: hypothetical protein ACOVN4_04375 [Bosea sp. (in: a-proteobacteria)]|jgi:hypothetical protein